MFWVSIADSKDLVLVKFDDGIKVNAENDFKFLNTIFFEKYRL